MRKHERTEAMTHPISDAIAQHFHPKTVILRENRDTGEPFLDCQAVWPIDDPRIWAHEAKWLLLTRARIDGHISEVRGFRVLSWMMPVAVQPKRRRKAVANKQ
jgi:hypothetical protein